MDNQWFDKSMASHDRSNKTLRSPRLKLARRPRRLCVRFDCDACGTTKTCFAFSIGMSAIEGIDQMFESSQRFLGNDWRLVAMDRFHLTLRRYLYYREFCIDEIDEPRSVFVSVGSLDRIRLSENKAREIV